MFSAIILINKGQNCLWKFLKLFAFNRAPFENSQVHVNISLFYAKCQSFCNHKMINKTKGKVLPLLAFH